MLELLVPCRDAKQPEKQENVPQFAVIAVGSVLPCEQWAASAHRNCEKF